MQAKAAHPTLLLLSQSAKTMDFGPKHQVISQECTEGAASQVFRTVFSSWWRNKNFGAGHRFFIQKQPAVAGENRAVYNEI
jgi:hypothetical protein